MTIYTIGHSNHDQGFLIALLKQHGIEMVIDVRSAPYSRYSPQFNRESLERQLNLDGITYAYAGEYLGGRPTDPSCYRYGVVPPSHSDFLKLVDYAAVATKAWYLRAIERLLELASDQRIAIMCSEEDPAECHRHHLVAQTLLQRGLEVWHIRKSGTLEEAQPSESVPTQIALEL
jgi:uncharacterized protein (DUF488 family)